MKVKRSNKIILKTAIIGGFLFALWMSIFDFIDKEPFSIAKFLLGFVSFGGSMAYSFRYNKEV